MIRSDRQAHGDLAGVLPAKLATILPRDPYGMRPLLRYARVIDNPGADLAAALHHRQGLVSHPPEQSFVRPWSLANEVQQRLVLGRHPSRLGHRRQRLHAPAFQRHQQAYAVIPQGNRTIGMTDNFDQST